MTKNSLIYLIMLSFMIVSCKKKEYFDSKYYKEQDLYFVKFIDKRGGVYESDYKYYYITDSLKFSKYIGNADEKEGFDIQFNEDQIIIEKFSRRNEGETKLLYKDVFSIKELKDDGDFDE